MTLNEAWARMRLAIAARGIAADPNDAAFSAGVAKGMGLECWGEPSAAGIELGQAMAEDDLAWRAWCDRWAQRTADAGGGLVAMLETMEDPRVFWAERDRMWIERRGRTETRR